MIPKTEIGYKSDIPLQNLHNPAQVLDVGRSGSRISRATTTPSGTPTYYLLIFFQKLHKNERKAGDRWEGARLKCYYVYPPLVGH